MDYVQKFFRKIRRNKCVFQNAKSKVCGHYAVYVLYHMAHGMPFDEVLARLHRSRNADNMVKGFINKISKGSRS